MNAHIETLTKIYTLFDRVTADFSLACREKCEDCCTCNVTATRLEVAYLFSCLDKKEIERVKLRLDKNLPDNRYRPGLTTNGFSQASLAGEPVQEEQNDPSWGQCPLLEDGRCTIYHARPFGCRSMMSQTPCRKTGYAQMSPLALTMGTIFLQYIEHLDAQGISGNFSDILILYMDPNFALNLSLENIKDSDKKEGFIRNRQISALMVPPEHRKDVTSIVKEMSALVQAG